MRRTGSAKRGSDRNTQADVHRPTRVACAVQPSAGNVHAARPTPSLRALSEPMSTSKDRDSRAALPFLSRERAAPAGPSPEQWAWLYEPNNSWAMGRCSPTEPSLGALSGNHSALLLDLQQMLRVKAGEKTQARVKSPSGEGALLGSGREFIQAVEIKGDTCVERCPSLERQMLHRRLLGRLAMERLSIF